MSLDDTAECQQCGTEMYAGAHFCVRCGSRLSDGAKAPEPRREPVLELTDFDSWLPTPASEQHPVPAMPAPANVAAVAPPQTEPIDAFAEASAVDANLALLEASASSPAAEAELSLEDVDRGFDLVDEKTTLSSCLPILVARKLSAAPEEKARRKSEYTREEVLRRARAKESLRRAGLAGLDLSGLHLEGVDLTLADLDGTKLDRAKLCGARLQNASLRGASLEGADLSGANLERADLSDARLVLAELSAVNLRCANLTSADLTGAILCGARLSGAELTSATLVRAKLRNAELDGADLGGADLAMIDLSEADLEDASLVLAKLVGANLQGATLVDADLTRVNASVADFSRASLVRTKLTAANLQNASLSQADASNADFRGADLSGTVLDGARLLQATLESIRVSASTRADGIDLSDSNSSRLLALAEGLAHIAGRPPTRERGTRYFGQGDLLRGARLDFEAGCKIHVDGRFENCVIVLGEGAEIVIGESGVLKNCQISGHGDIKVHGCFFERQSPGISGPRSFIVSAKGAVAAVLEQLTEPTAFAFEPGCRLRIKISQPLQQAAE